MYKYYYKYPYKFIKLAPVREFPGWPLQAIK